MRSSEKNERLAELLDEARNQLKVGELLAYGTQESFEAMYEQLAKIEENTADGKGDLVACTQAGELGVAVKRR
jgi:hypothetical protein